MILSTLMARAPGPLVVLVLVVIGLVAARTRRRIHS
jgi:hypothetical protein